MVVCKLKCMHAYVRTYMLTYIYTWAHAHPSLSRTLSRKQRNLSEPSKSVEEVGSKVLSETWKEPARTK